MTDDQDARFDEDAALIPNGCRNAVSLIFKDEVADCLIIAIANKCNSYLSNGCSIQIRSWIDKRFFGRLMKALIPSRLSATESIANNVPHIPNAVPENQIVSLGPLADTFEIKGVQIELPPDI